MKSCLILAVGSIAAADVATLVQQTTIIDNPEIGVIDGSDGFGNPGFALNRGDGIVTGFIDAAMLEYDFGDVESVAQATLTVEVITIWKENGDDPTINLFAGPDDGVIQLTDITIGGDGVIDSHLYEMLETHAIDVTDAVNAALAESNFVLFRFENATSPFDLPNVLEGVRFLVDSPLEFEPGSPCYPDVNGDGVLNILDFVAFQALFQSGDPEADCNGDGGAQHPGFRLLPGRLPAGLRLIPAEIHHGELRLSLSCRTISAGGY